MSLGGLNYMAVMVAAIASFIFGGVWYNLFSKQWMEALGMTPDKMPPRSLGILSGVMPSASIHCLENRLYQTPPKMKLAMAATITAI